MTQFIASTLAIALASTAIGAPAAAKETVELTKCAQSYGTIAVVDGDTQGWTEYGLGSPKQLINSLALESGCFTPLNDASGKPADFLMNVIAGDKEEVDQSIDVAKSAATTALVQSGALGSVLSNVPMGGALLGMFGGLGGKKKTVAAGIKLISPANGQTVAFGSGSVKKSSISFGGAAGGWVQSAQSSGYTGNKNGKMMVEAFVMAFNEVAAQGAALASISAATDAPMVAAQATVASNTTMLRTPSANAEKVRDLMSGTTLNVTGKREGLFIEVSDNYGTTGWVSVETLN